MDGSNRRANAVPKTMLPASNVFPLPKRSFIRPAVGAIKIPTTYTRYRSVAISVEKLNKEPVKRKLYLLEDPESGKTYLRDEKAEGFEVLKTRDVDSHKIMWYKTNGHEILEGPTEVPSTYIPIVEVWGKELNIEGQTIYKGIIRNAKDPQRLYNFSRSHNAELTSLAPKAPYLATAKMIKNIGSTV